MRRAPLLPSQCIRFALSEAGRSIMERQTSRAVLWTENDNRGNGPAINLQFSTPVLGDRKLLDHSYDEESNRVLYRPFDLLRVLTVFQICNMAHFRHPGRLQIRPSGTHGEPARRVDTGILGGTPRESRRASKFQLPAPRSGMDTLLWLFHVPRSRDLVTGESGAPLTRVCAGNER